MAALQQSPEEALVDKVLGAEQPTGRLYRGLITALRDDAQTAEGLAAARKILVRCVECACHTSGPRALLVHQLSVDAVDAGSDRASHGGDRHGRATLGAAQDIVER